ncbi:Eukaryotic translation initiation factor 3 subunit [Hortaea werneckii]|nr:Eukaryotic translation initiation factor 3 subunit [Hortaea werneckii]
MILEKPSKAVFRASNDGPFLATRSHALQISRSSSSSKPTERKAPGAKCRRLSALLMTKSNGDSLPFQPLAPLLNLRTTASPTPLRGYLLCVVTLLPITAASLLLPSFASRLAFAIAATHRQRRRRQPVRQVDLRTDRVGQSFSMSSAEGWFGFFVQDVRDVVGDALEHLEDGLDRAFQRLDVGCQELRAVFPVTGSGNDFQSTLLGFAVLDLVRDRDKETAIGGAFGGGADGRRDVGVSLDVLAGFGAHGQVDGRVGPGAFTLLRVEVLDQGGEGVEFAAGGVPAEQHFLGACAQVELQHALLVVHVDLDLLGRLGVGDGIAVLYGDLGAVFTPGAEEGADDSGGVSGAAGSVVEDGDECLGLDRDVERGDAGRRGECPGCRQRERRPWLRWSSFGAGEAMERAMPRRLEWKRRDATTVGWGGGGGGEWNYCIALPLAVHRIRPAPPRVRWEKFKRGNSQFFDSRKMDFCKNYN